MNTQHTITRRLEIDAAHRVPDHKSKCFNLHGHRYVINATVAGELVAEGDQTGMVMDFSFLKECMQECIYDPCDHGTIFYIDDPMYKGLLEQNDWLITGGIHYERVLLKGWKILVIDRVPTAENLAEIWAHQLQDSVNRYFRRNYPDMKIPVVIQMDVHETPNCVATWRNSRIVASLAHEPERLDGRTIVG